MIKVANIRTFKPDGSIAVKVDRTSPLGNPYTLTRESARDLVCDKYDVYFQKRKNSTILSGFASELARLRALSKTNDITLLCWCAPKRCHAETIKQYLDDYLNFCETWKEEV